MREFGRVKFFKQDSGFGFIKRAGAQEVFFHAQDLRSCGIVDFALLTKGVGLEFDVVGVDGKGPKAVNIRLVGNEF